MGMRQALVVDDSRGIRWAIRQILEALEFEVVEAENGATALDLCRSGEIFDVILLDIDMPVMDGLQFLEGFGRLSMASRVPVVMCTTNSRPETIRRAVDAGASEYIMKPFTEDIMRRKLSDIGVLR